MKIKLTHFIFFLLTFYQLTLAEEILTPPGFSQRSEIKIEEIEAKEGKIPLVIVYSLDYISSPDDTKYLESMTKLISEKKGKFFILRPSGYTPTFQTVGLKVFSSKQDENTFQYYLHDLCYDKRILLSQDEEYARYTRLIQECYIQETRNFLRGEKRQFAIYHYFGKLPNWSETSDFFWGGILYLLLFISSLPHLVLFLFIFSFFQNYFRHKEYNRKLVTVLIPFAYGFGWIFVSASLGENYRWNFWGMGIWKLLFYFSGLFFGLGFLGVKLLVNRIFYPDEDSFPNWAIGVILLFSPILIFAAGGALGGGKSSSSSTSKNTNQSKKETSNLGGGKSGGGGAGGKF